MTQGWEVGFHVFESILTHSSTLKKYATQTNHGIQAGHVTDPLLEVQTTQVLDAIGTILGHL